MDILLAPAKTKGRQGKNQFQQLMDLLPNDHKAKWFAGAALNTAEQSMSSVMSTALSRLNQFLDSELEQLLCFDTEIDAEKFCNEKSAIFVIMPEENPNTFFMISLILQQMYFGEDSPLIPDENGQFTKPSNFRKRFYRILEACGVKENQKQKEQVITPRKEKRKGKAYTASDTHSQQRLSTGLSNRMELSRTCR